MNFRLEKSPPLQVVGLCRQMSLVVNTTHQLWQEFMPKRQTISQPLNAHFYAVDRYPEDYFQNFDPSRTFERWAAMAVRTGSAPPAGMQAFTIPPGDYAVFEYVGPASQAAEAYQYIFSQWLPSSSFQADVRPHLAVMGEHYRGEDPSSQEELWIPIKPR